MENEKPCVFCNLSTPSIKDELGEFLQIGKFHFHANCLVYSFYIRQNQDRTKGLYGFEENNIDLAIRRCKNKICVVCKKPGATVRCFGKDQGRQGRFILCRTSYHLPCALQAKCTLHQSQTNTKFGTYCSDHNQHDCTIHIEPITGIQPNTPCCDKLHTCKEGIKELVKESKALTRCPSCQNKGTFRRFVRKKLKLKISKGKPSYAANRPYDGHDLACEAEICLAPEKKGQDEMERRKCYKEYNKDYDLINCAHCGDKAIHPKCLRKSGKKLKTEWICQECEEISAQIETPTGGRSASRPENAAIRRNPKQLVFSEEESAEPKTTSTRTKRVPHQTGRSENTTSKKRKRDTSTVKPEVDSKPEKKKKTGAKGTTEPKPSKLPESKSIATRTRSGLRSSRV